MIARTNGLWLVVVGFTAMGLGCGEKPSDPYASIKFNDNPIANATVTAEQVELAFLDATGKKVKLTDYRGKNNVVLVFMRGSPGGA